MKTNRLCYVIVQLLVLRLLSSFQLRGQVDDCYCRISDVDRTHSDSFENLAELLKRDYFRFYKVNLDKPCEFWEDRGVCTRSTCALKTCTEAEVPSGLAENTNKSTIPTCEEERELSKINNFISDDRIAALQNLEKQESDNINFCVQEDEDSEKAEFYDLLQNPESYTGYSGEPSWRIWRSIYEENCFKPKKDSLFLDLTHKSINYMCKEKRVFFRAVSGLHSSISIHLAAKYPVQDFFGQKWGPNLAEFTRRFLPESTAGEGPHWLKNLYFVYLVEMRAITKALPLWKRWDFHTGKPEEDIKTKENTISIVEGLLSCPDTFDEEQLFKGPAAEEILNEFLVHFRNISQIMDCVTCDKCRLWGKIQIRGLGTALKILFSGGKPENLNLERGEVVTLFNAFNQLSHSLHYVKVFKDQMDYKEEAGPPEESDRKQENLFNTFTRGEL
ncbi:ERO1-like protein beta [Bolinopsis microptera]|uniref:ERO1-like protein beta n=1 Tax=Bolinopsis microptera TaxID=2820187 RepID=UPI0030790DBB